MLRASFSALNPTPIVSSDKNRDSWLTQTDLRVCSSRNIKYDLNASRSLTSKNFNTTSSNGTEHRAKVCAAGKYRLALSKACACEEDMISLCSAVCTPTRSGRGWKRPRGDPCLCKFECDVKVLFLQVDLPHITVFVSDNELEKRLIGVDPVCLTHGIRSKCPDYLAIFL
jgi:hypothetical protein